MISKIYKMTDEEFMSAYLRSILIIGTILILLAGAVCLICPPASALTATMGEEVYEVSWTHASDSLQRIEAESDYIDLNPGSQGLAIYNAWILVDPGVHSEITLYQLDGSTITGYIHDNRTILGGDVEICMGADITTYSGFPVLVYANGYDIYSAANETTSGVILISPVRSNNEYIFAFTPVSDLNNVPISRIVISSSENVFCAIEVDSPESLWELAEARDNGERDVSFFWALIDFVYDAWPILNTTLYIFGQIVENFIPLVVLFEGLAAAVAFGKSRNIWKASKKWYMMNKEFMGSLLKFIQIIVEIFSRIIGVIVPW